MSFKAPDSLAEQIAQHLSQRIIRGELKPCERIQEIKVTSELSVSRGSVREALLILQRRHLVSIPPRRGAMVAELTPHSVRALYALVKELYMLLAAEVAGTWQQEQELERFAQIQQGLLHAVQANDVQRFVDNSFEILHVGLSFVDNPYLKEVVLNLLPAIQRTYYFSLAHRAAEMHTFLDTYARLLQAIRQRDQASARQVMDDYAQHNCALVIAALND
ncbi:GntR family transcriptional regulator [Atopomonas sediminilitoris]|uniref:GntR family transcriptional regulator n=1 Tax=Atopomonas sediminilitoris TaxID=2919919 RepID=UPI001F4DEC8B|nr:GntR family transcriptional regulator [Atopomonas sediminilitoris]MCJ8167904.1 GntR family transcriptional regulator [Atopomonas sediminilitoris]